MKSKISILVVVLAVALAACLENNIEYNTDDLDYRPMELSAPIGKIHAPLYENMEKALGDDFEGSLYVRESDGMICIKYTRTEKIDWSDEIGINDFASNTEIWPSFNLGNLPQVGVTFEGDTIYEVLFSTGEAKDTYVSDAELSDGKLKISIVMPSHLTSWTVKVTIPELEKEGEVEPFSHTFTNLQPQPKEVETLDGYKISTTDKKLRLKCEFSVEGTLSSSDRATINCFFSGIKVNYMKGFFGQTTKKDTVKMNLDFFNNLGFDGAAGIKGISFETKMTNSIGMPFHIEAKRIAYFNDYKDTITLSNPSTPFDMNVPSATADINHNVTSAIKKSDPYILSDLEFKDGKFPVGVLAVFSGISNPAGNPSVTNFIVHNVDTLAKAQITLNVPLHLKVENYSRSDTLKFDYNEKIGRDNNVEYAYVNLLVDNALPFDVELQAYVINESDSVGLIMHEDIIANRQGQSFEIKLNENQLEQFSREEVKNIVFKTNAQTAKLNDVIKFVEVKKDACLDIAVSVRIKGEIVPIILNNKEE